MINRIFLIGALVILTSCATRQDSPSEIVPAVESSGEKVDELAQTETITPGELAAEKLAAIEPSVYFDYDKYEIKDQFSLTIEAFSEFMRTNPGSNLMIEGHCDERGTIEYNIALGQKRADAVKSALVAMGIDGNRIETISYGEERPRSNVKSETGFSINRRADLISK